MKHLTHDQIERVNGLVRSLQKNYFAQETVKLQLFLSPSLDNLLQQQATLTAELKGLVEQDPMAREVVNYALRVSLFN